MKITLLFLFAAACCGTGFAGEDRLGDFPLTGHFRWKE